MNRKRIFQLIFASLLVIVPLVVTEVIFRAFIFSPSGPFKQLKNPGNYAKESTDDYWKLYYQLGGHFGPPEHPHPLLGWIGNFDRNTLDHDDIKQTGNRRNVLIYGDSFIMCAHDSIECFDEILNADTAFNKNNFLLNYGVGGYGVDQIYLLFSHTIDKFQNPFVVFSIMPADMDRCMLSVRTGQKPYFTISNDSLCLLGLPIDSVPAHFFKTNPPEITSYMWRRIANSKYNPYYSPFPTDSIFRTKIMTLNKKIILKAYDQIKQRNLQYVFVVFDELWNIEGLWRADSLKTFLTEQNINYINTAQLIQEDTLFKGHDYFSYMIKGDGHPKSYYNKLLCEEIKKYMADYTAYPQFRQKQQSEEVRGLQHILPNTMEYYELKIRKDGDWLNKVKEKAKQKNIPVDSMIKLDAIWMVENEKNNQKK